MYNILGVEKNINHIKLLKLILNQINIAYKKKVGYKLLVTIMKTKEYQNITGFSSNKKKKFDEIILLDLQR